MKTVTVLLTAVMLMCCNVKSNSDDRLFPERGRIHNLYYGKAEDVKYGGMHYVVYSVSNGGVGFTNITKDSLECELLKKELLK